MRSAVRAGRAFRRDPLAFVRGLGEWRDVMRFHTGLSEFTLVNHPDLIRRILVPDNDLYGEGKWTLRGKHVMGDCLITREGDAHRQRRALVGPSFDRKRLAERVPAMVRCVERLTAGWASGDRIDAHRAMGQLAITMAGAVLFDADLESEAAELSDALVVMLGAIPRLPLPSRRLAAARRRVERTAARLTGGDLVSRLRQAGLFEAEIRDELVSLLIAAVDTTPRALAWTWFLLGRHPSVESRFHEELLAVLGGGPATGDDLQRLTFMQMVLNETLRLYPPVHFIDRRPLRDVELGGVRVRAGSYMLLSPLITHRDPRFFEEPGVFRPERWDPSCAAQRPGRLSFPFGAGPHACIGEGLARLEISITLATVAAHWRLRPAPELPGEPSPQTARLPMILERRG